MTRLTLSSLNSQASDTIAHDGNRSQTDSQHNRDDRAA